MSSSQPRTRRANRARPTVVAKAPAPEGKRASESKGTASRIKPGLITAAILALFVAIALFIRIVLPYDRVFTSEGIKFTSNDSYFFMRLVDNIVHNFPHYTAADPYHIYPAYSGRVEISFFVWLLSVPAWLANLVWPGQHTIDVVDAYLPAVLGALTVIPVYFIGKELFGRWAGVLSAGLIAILPGEFLGRSILAFTDNHVAEVLFSTTALLFLILAVKAANQRNLTFGHLRMREWATVKKPLVYSLLAAFFLSVYMFTWLGALLFVFMSFVFFGIQFIIDHLKHKSTGYLCFVGVIFYFVNLLLFLLIFYRSTRLASPGTARLELYSLIIAGLAILALNGVSRWMALKKIRPVYYPLALVGLVVVAGGLFYLADRSLFNAMLNAFGIFKPTGAALTTIEMQPLISPQYGNRLAIAWGNFSVGFFLSFISLAILVYLMVKQGTAEKTLLLIWSLVIVLATLGQRRFGYYLAVNVALLTGYLSWKVIGLAKDSGKLSFLTLLSIPVVNIVPFMLGLATLDSIYLITTLVVVLFSGLVVVLRGGSSNERSRAARRAATRGAGQGGHFPLTVNFAVSVLAVLVIFFGVFFWDIEPAKVVASSTPYAPSDAWVSSMNWLRENSPEPLGSTDAYNKVYPALAAGETFQFPQSAYGVLAWWDYGYWITRIAHRIPNANPSQDPIANKNVALFFTSQNETAANEMGQTLGAAYIVIDHETTLSKFWAIITWAGGDPTQFFDTYLVPQQNNSFRPAILYYPEYYHSMAVRLFNFDGKPAGSDSPFVITYTDNKDKAGNAYKVITGAKQFTTLDEARAYLATQPAGKSRIVGTNPLKSPVPLDAVEHYELVHSSNQTVSTQDGTSFPSIKIFQYTK